jgi:hypothetical protein
MVHMGSEVDRHYFILTRPSKVGILSSIISVSQVRKPEALSTAG